MIEMGYSDQAIVSRLRHSLEVVELIRREIESERTRKDEDWDETE